jgi:DNA-binding response OmpR family regulator
MPIRVLLLEDNPDSGLMLKTLLETLTDFYVVWVMNLAGALAAVQAEAFTVALIDLNVGDEQGLATFTRLQAAAPDLPIVILSAMANNDLAVEAVHNGAQDYLTKPCDERQVIRAILFAVERHAQALTGKALETARLAVNLLREVFDRLEPALLIDAK